MIATGCLASVLVCGWYLIQNTVRYGSPLASAASRRYLTQIGGGLGMPYGVPYRVTDPLKTIFLDIPTKFIHVFFYGFGSDTAFLKPLPLPVSLLFWLLLAFALVGLIGRHVSRMMLVVLGTLALAGFLSVWIVAFQTATYDHVWPWLECRRSHASPLWASNVGDSRSGSFCRSWDWAPLSLRFRATAFCGLTATRRSAPTWVARCHRR